MKGEQITKKDVKIVCFNFYKKIVEKFSKVKIFNRNNMTYYLNLIYIYVYIKISRI